MNEISQNAARQNMVDCQLRPMKVIDPCVLAAFSSVPREKFVGKNQRTIAYADEDLPLGGGRWLIEPMVLARMIQALNVRADDHTMVVGCATGYGTAIMAGLAVSVISVESRLSLVEKAQELLVAIGADNAAVVKSKLVDGFEQEGPYDRILIEGAVGFMPEKLLEQLTPKGVLVSVWRPNGSSGGVASLWSRSGDSFVRTSLFDAQIPVFDEFKPKPEFNF